MIEEGLKGVDFIVANTDSQALDANKAEIKVQIGDSLTKGLGAGANPETGRRAAMEDKERLREFLTGADMIFITAGMGGGTGTGAAPVFAEVAKELDILTVAVVTRPFSFEKRTDIADKGIEELERHVDSLIVIPNDKLPSVLGEKTLVLDAFAAANDVLLGAVQGISDLITRPGLMNTDFADVRTVMSEMGKAMMGTGRATGENRAREAAETAIRCPLLEDIELEGARGALVNVVAGSNLNLAEVFEVGNTVEEFTSPECKVVLGMVVDPEWGDDLKVTVVVTGLSDPEEGRRDPAEAPRDGVGGAPDETDEPVNYEALERPAYLRDRKERRVDPTTEVEPEGDDSYLDLKAFLNRTDP
jgi:cell division protein FtsZ